MGSTVGLAVESAVGSVLWFAVAVGLGLVGPNDGYLVGSIVGFWVGSTAGFSVGFIVGFWVGSNAGFSVGFAVGVLVASHRNVGFMVGFPVGFLVGFDVGSNVPIAVLKWHPLLDRYSTSHWINTKRKMQRAPRIQLSSAISSKDVRHLVCNHSIAIHRNIQRPSRDGDAVRRPVDDVDC